jgi:hypothetical protein
MRENRLYGSEGGGTLNQSSLPLSGTEAPFLRRSHPVSSLLWASPPPATARPAPRGGPVGGHAPPPWGLPVLRRISLFSHAASCTPARLLVRIARGTAYSNRFPETSDGGLPQDTDASALATKVSGPPWSSLVLQPARSRDRQAVLSVEGLDGFASSPATPIATGWSDPVAGRELHPLKLRAFARRSMSPFAPGQFVRPKRVSSLPQTSIDWISPGSAISASAGDHPSRRRTTS